MPMRYINRRKPSEDPEDPEDMEKESLVNTGVSRRAVARKSRGESNSSHPSRYPWVKPLVVGVTLATVVGVSLYESTHEPTPPMDDAALNAPSIQQISFACPTSHVQLAVDNEHFEDHYTWKSEGITKNQTEFLKTFRKQHFDGWGATYETVKKWSTPFKDKYYPQYLQPGMTLYESACGIGLNLFMTLEILQEHNITGITVYGNDYVAESEAVTQMVLGEGVIPKGNQKGVICPADSRNLSHVPSNSFDVVYTGYVTPLQDPLNILTEEEYHGEDWSKYDQICAQGQSQKPEEWMGTALYKEALAKQEAWFGQWVGEMARIAKPGAPVIVEQVSYSYCTQQNDWDGVDKDFWNKTATTNAYNWNIDPASIEIMDMEFREKRYNVFMLKKK